MAPLGYRVQVPGFMSGMAQVLDLTGGGPFFQDRSGFSPAERDARALAGDWQSVGRDLRAALSRYRSEMDQARGTAGDGAW